MKTRNNAGIQGNSGCIPEYSDSRRSVSVSIQRVSDSIQNVSALIQSVSDSISSVSAAIQLNAAADIEKPSRHNFMLPLYKVISPRSKVMWRQIR